MPVDIEPLGLIPRSVSSLLRAAEAVEARDPASQRRAREAQERLLQESGTNHHSET